MPRVTEATILLLGDPRLRQPATEVGAFDDARFALACGRLAATLEAVRERHGFGRAIAATQIGTPLRVIALCLGSGPSLVVNPVVTWESKERMTLWDDCLSFPDILVRVSRHRSISIAYRDERGRPQTWDRLEPAESELLQHEIDHLDGILAVDRALDRDSLVLREVFEARRAELLAMVDYPERR